ncbi:hypothetical protein CWI38_0158p0030 [Hamiltosporidium tvaerminnensis]|uniref:Uncharacterized protein n=2 Tax=Hamiltosporidium TaxID=1176354 RepID=A0A4Q9KW47_9MICR|nr:hypothetical protein CWI37_2162p0010 [Hamiltosporidium tvaerminnensis]TBT99103.1 hypothetical protein CWI39_2144p0020 [Hamiltosporidium magnivora]TBU05174.1 hypothetical protein CWI36_0667p0030 [Hamiltosporidium magnivora]TBU19990.1 hypothetical protein CWI38_0158p0030 [Hamiltosporidium tvaerminnensis]
MSYDFKSLDYENKKYLTFKEYMCLSLLNKKYPLSSSEMPQKIYKNDIKYKKYSNILQIFNFLKIDKSINLPIITPFSLINIRNKLFIEISDKEIFEMVNLLSSTEEITFDLFSRTFG